jgi:hypothetical protein
MAKLRKENASDIIPRLEILQQNYATMSAEIPQLIRDEVAKAVKLNVNGKIDAMRIELAEHNKKHNEDMASLMPYMQFASGLGVIWKLVVALGSLAVAWATIKSAFPNFHISL